MLIQLTYSGNYYDISESGIAPERELAINQLQELFQKGYVEKPEYEFRKLEGGEASVWMLAENRSLDKTKGDAGECDATWECRTECGMLVAAGCGRTKTEAKKMAAFAMLEKIFRNAG